jgi:tetratricopeptide (TPR) repeat protein
VTSDRIQRQIDRLLDEAEAAITSGDWSAARMHAQSVLALDDSNADARAYIVAADRSDFSTQPPAKNPISTVGPVTAPQPTSFAGGRYEVLRFLGEGGKKKVYLAKDTLLDREVAFALIKTEDLDEASRTRVTREAQAMGRLGDHPNIVTVYDIGEQNGQPYMVLPVLPGGDIEGVIEKAEDHRLPIEQAIKFAIETCEGLEFAHGRGIVHRDLKPGNVWLTESGTAKIGDFGLAVATDRSRLTQAGMMVGTVSYMPPEQAMGGDATAQSDLYSLGAMLYEMVCGRPPFVGDESVAIIGQHLNTPPVAPTWHRPDCPFALETLILRLLEKDATKRPASAAAVREALQAVQTGRPTTATVDGASTAPSYDPLYRRTFVGREQEVNQLHQAYDAALSGRGGLVMVAGEPGIGKTALCEQLATYVQLRGGKTLVGHCYEEGSHSLPYLAFVEAMRTYVLDHDSEALRSELGTGAADVARIVSEVRDRVQVELRDVTDPEDDRWRLLNAISTFLRNAAAVQPLVIVLEDLHWSDRGTLDLLLHVARNLEGSRLLLVGTYRDVEVDRSHPLSAALGDLRRINTFLRIPLRGLSVDEVHRMYEAIRGNTVPWSQAENVHHATEGNPLFVQEVLRYLVEEGIVVREDGRYVAEAPGAAVPDGLRDVVGRRLSRLSETTNKVLSVASVIGRDFSVDVLQRVAEVPEEELLTALEEASSRSIIEQRQSAGSLGFRFTHAFFRQTLYEEIFAPRRIRWHQRVGFALEEVYSRRLEEHAAELAEHFSQSTETADLAKAVLYGELAATRAINVFDYGEAVQHLERALRAQDVLDPDDNLRRCDLLLKLGDAQLPLGEPRKVIDTIATPAFTLAELLWDDERASRACVLAQDSLMRAGTGPGAFSSMEAQVWIRRLVNHALPGTAFEAHAVLLSGLMEGLSTNIERLNVGLELARHAGNPNVLMLGAWVNAAGLYTLHHWRKALELTDEFWDLREGVSSRMRSMFVQYAGCTRLLAGDREGYFTAGEELTMIASRTGDANINQSSRANEALRLILDGRVEEAYEASLSALQTGRELGIYSIAPEIAGFQAALYLGMAPELFERENSHEFLNLLMPYMEAFGSANPQVGIPSRDTLVGREPDSLSGIGLYVSLAAKRGEEESLRSVLDDLDGSDAAFTGPVAILSLARIAGSGAETLGEHDRARSFYKRAIGECTTVNHRPELALSHLELAELLLDHYPDEHNAAIEHLDFAIAELRDMKMQPALERALGRRGLLKA